MSCMDEWPNTDGKEAASWTDDINPGTDYPTLPSHLKEKHRTPDRDEIFTTTGEPGPKVSSGIERQSCISHRYPD